MLVFTELEMAAYDPKRTLNIVTIGESRMIKNSNLRTSVSLVCLVAAGLIQCMQPAQSHETGKPYSTVLKIATTFVCDNESFIKHAKLDADACSRRIEFHGEHCWEVVEPLYPGDDFDGSDEEKIEVRTLLSQLFITCVQAEILLEDMYRESLGEK